MPRPRNPIPKPRCHKGAAVVDIYDGGKRRTITLGAWGSEQAEVEFARLLGDRRTSDGRIARPDLTVNEMLAAFMKWAATHYRTAAGEPTTEISELVWSNKLLRELYAHTLAANFGPLALEAVRNRMVEAGWCRTTINRRIDRIRRAFKWAVSKELVPASVHQSLTTLAGLRRGRTTARESAPVKPVPAAVVAATLPFLGRHLRTMAEIQRLSGMRPGEVCAMKMAEIDRTAIPWTYRPTQHKTAHHGRERVVMIGPRAQTILEDFLAGSGTIAPAETIFSPRRAREERFATGRAARKSKVTPSQAHRRKAKPKLIPAVSYKPHAYAHAVRVAAKKAGAAHWHPNQLRHAFASNARKAHGLEAAQVLLGHSRADVTQTYAERDLTLAASVAGLIG